MARTNLNNLTAKLAAAADAVAARLEQERHADAARIQHHIDSSKAQIELLMQAEAELINYINTYAANTVTGVQATFARLREDEQRRMSELVSHGVDINTEEPPEMIEHQPPPRKRIKAVG